MTFANYVIVLKQTKKDTS